MFFGMLPSSVEILADLELRRRTALGILDEPVKKVSRYAFYWLISAIHRIEATMLVLPCTALSVYSQQHGGHNGTEDAARGAPLPTRRRRTATKLLCLFGHLSLETSSSRP